MSGANKVAVFLRLASRPVPRVARMMGVARDAGFECSFVGAFRDSSLPEQDSWEGFPILRVGKPFPLLNGKKPWLYLRSLVTCNRAFFSVLRKKRPKIVHASDFETIPASILYRLTHKTRLVYNIHDNLAQRYALPTLVKALLNAMEGVAVLCSDRTVVPESFRRDGLPWWCRARVDVIPNVPAENEQSPAPAIDRRNIVVFYGGWLDWQRGLAALLELSKEPGIDVRIAGEGSREIVDRLKDCDTITYLGFLRSADVIEETRRCHFVPVLYDPAREINRFAASNKLAEALAIGRPVIMNDELEIAKSMHGLDCVVATPYDKARCVAGKLRVFQQNPGSYAKACEGARDWFERRYSWERIYGVSREALLGRRVKSQPEGEDTSSAITH